MLLSQILLYDAIQNLCMVVLERYGLLLSKRKAYL